MSKKMKPRNLPIRTDLGERIGVGQDNAVYELLQPAEKPHLRVPLDWVIKINNDLDGKEGVKQGNIPRHKNPREAAWRGIQYKRNKYEILKHFLGEYIPNSAFVLGPVLTKVRNEPPKLRFSSGYPTLNFRT